MVLAQDEEEVHRTLDYPPCFHLRQLLSQEWKKADVAQTIKLEAEPLIVAEKESSVTTATEGGEERDAEVRGSVMGRMDGSELEWAAFGTPQKVGVSTFFPPEGRGKVWICYLEQI